MESPMYAECPGMSSECEELVVMVRPEKRTAYSGV